MKKNNSQKNWENLIAALAQGVVIIDDEGKIIYANPYALDLFQQNRSQLLGTNFLYPLETDTVQEVEILSPENEIRTAEMTVKRGAWKDRPAWIVSLQDITSRRAKNERLEILSNGFNSAHEGIIITDAKGRIIDANPALEKITGYTKEELLGKNPKFYSSGKQSYLFYKKMWEQLSKEGHWNGEIWNKNKEGKIYPAFLTISAIKDPDGETINYTALYHDLSQLKAQEKQIMQERLYDYQTGLPNSILLAQNLEEIMAEINQKEKNLIIFNISLCTFNDNKKFYMRKPALPNQIILEAVKRINKVTDSKYLLARTHLNEFVVIYYTKKNLSSLDATAQAIIRVLSQPYDNYNDTKESIGANIGITDHKKENPLGYAELLSQAEVANYQSSLCGKNTLHYYNPKTERDILAFNRHVNDMHKAISGHQFREYYQPKINLKTGEIIGAEALLRWQHPNKGLLTPAYFLYDIDNHPISLEIGHWMLNAVLKKMERLFDANSLIPISVNISAYQLQQQNFVKNIEKTLNRYPKIPNQFIKLEILETEVIENKSLVAQIIANCREKGILFALDDFGTGYSSLTQLKELNVSELKIDRSFILNILSSPEDLAILKTTIDLCNLLNCDVIAEGVETITHGKLLLTLGCERIQGYAIAKPMQGNEFSSWLKTWELSDKWHINAFSDNARKEVITAILDHFSYTHSVYRHTGCPNLATNVGSDYNHCAFQYWLKKYKSEFEEALIYERLDDWHQKSHIKAAKIMQLFCNQQEKLAYQRIIKLKQYECDFLKSLLTTVFS